MSTFTPGPVHLATIDRQTVRGLVDVEGDYLKSIAVAGGNVHQIALDRQDAIQLFTSTLSPEESIKFYELYNQEIAQPRRPQTTICSLRTHQQTPS